MNMEEDDMEEIKEKIEEIGGRVEEVVEEIRGGTEESSERLEQIQRSLRERRCKAVCATCQGTGKEKYGVFSHEIRTCPACNGRGYVDAFRDEEGNLIKCATCKGTGKEKYGVFADNIRRCSACNGRGYV